MSETQDPVAVALGVLMSARASLDTAIEVLTNVPKKKPPEPLPIKDADGNCLHTHRKPLNTMGDEQMELCTDCDAIVPAA